MRRFLIGVDLGSINDWTSIAVLEQDGHAPGRRPSMGYHSIFNPSPELPETENDRAVYGLRHLERHLGEPYTKIAARVEEIAGQPVLSEGDKTLRIVVDATGVGRPVVDLLAENGLKHIVPITITGGDSVTKDHVRGRLEYRVPKRDLVGVLQVLMQNQLLTTRKTLELREALVKEMLNFKVKISAETGHDSYEHWRSGDHDDLVLAVALACWYGENG